MLGKEIGVDLGTVNVLVYVQGKGIVLQEPSVVAISIEEDKIVAVGEEARAMMGRTPGAFEVIRPLRDGVIADYMVTERMLHYFLRKAGGISRLFRPRVMVSVPYGVTSVERRAVREAALDAGAGRAYLIPEPLAAALGAGLPISTPSGNMVVDLGGGASEAAVIAMNGIVAASSVRVGGIRLDEAIAAYVRRKYNLIIGQPTAEEVKIRIGSALPLDEPLTMEVQGRDQVAGLPRTIDLSSEEITEALAEPLVAMVNMIKSVLERTPPELSSDIIERGIALVGGTALLRRMDEMITQKTGVPAWVAEAPMACVAIGAGRALEQYEILRRSVPDIDA
ncbi:MAG TPA: rod shape-determining protein [Anaerolineales bacterium]|nr:rod shape-determining protein [Anaerolineae bacterium]HIQ02040.1 rod shape-determining protein [Anaerolineales bacterium]